MTKTVPPLECIARAVLVVAIAATGPALAGCSLIGAGIGSVVPRYESVDDRAWHVRVGEEIRVVLLRPAAPREIIPRDDGGHIDGRYAGSHDAILYVTVDDRVEPREIPFTDIAEVRVRDGNHWTTGLLVGGAVDVTVLVVGAIAFSQARDMQIDVGSFR